MCVLNLQIVKLTSLFGVGKMDEEILTSYSVSLQPTLQGQDLVPLSNSRRIPLMHFSFKPIYEENHSFINIEYNVLYFINKQTIQNIDNSLTYFLG